MTNKIKECFYNLAGLEDPKEIQLSNEDLAFASYINNENMITSALSNLNFAITKEEIDYAIAKYNMYAADRSAYAKVMKEIGGEVSGNNKKAKER